MGDIIQDESKEYLINLATNIASGMGLYPIIILGICERESSWNPWAMRFEPAFKSKYIDPMHLPEPEATLRATSFGLMQLLGESAREMGYKDNLQELVDPEINLMWGCRWFEKKLVVASGVLADALQDWNGGSNPNYATEVLELANKYIK
jgi:soluble lytic murein transglycosylase-like protein